MSKCCLLSLCSSSAGFRVTFYTRFGQLALIRPHATPRSFQGRSKKLPWSWDSYRPRKGCSKRPFGGGSCRRDTHSNTIPLILSRSSGSENLMRILPYSVYPSVVTLCLSSVKYSAAQLKLRAKRNAISCVPSANMN